MSTVCQPCTRVAGEGGGAEVLGIVVYVSVGSYEASDNADSMLKETKDRPDTVWTGMQDKHRTA